MVNFERTAGRGPRSVLKNLLFSVASYSSNVFLMVLYVVAARFLGNEDFGKFSFAWSLVSMFSPLTGHAMNTLSTIAVARDFSRVNSYFGNYLTIQLILSLFTFSAIWLVSRLMTLPEETQIVILILAGAMILRSMKLSLRMLFQALDRFNLEAYLQFAGQLSLTIACAVVLWVGGSLIHFVITFALVRLLDFVCTFGITRMRLAPLWFRTDFSIWPSLVKTGTIFTMIEVLCAMSFRVDSILLGLMRSDAEVGWYNAPYNLFEGLLQVPALITATLLPALAVAHTTSRQHVVNYYQKAYKYLLALAAPISIFVYLFAGEVILLCFGNQYLPSIVPLKFLMATLPFFCLSWLAYTVVMSIDRPLIVLSWVIVGTGINVALNLMLIPPMGVSGAALSTLITECFVFFVGTWFLFSQDYGFPWFKVTIKIAAASIIFGLSVWMLRPWSFPIPLVVGAVGYLLSLTIIKFWEDEELSRSEKVL
jgi:O-antigen/teichoic acid export membrane protein